MRKLFSWTLAAAGLAAAWGSSAGQNATAQDPKQQDAKPAAVKKGLGATPASSFRLPEGFQAELVYEVPSKEQGSWVAMCVDLKGRLIVSDQYGKLYRVTPSTTGNPADTKVDPINVNLGMAQGLLHTKDGLYVDVNGEGILDKDQKDAPSGPGLYRLQDLDGDEQFEKIERIIPLTGGGEHGPHAIIPGPDGRLYLCAGNQTDLPEKIDRSRVPRHWNEDHLLGRMPDARGFMATRLAPGGFILSFNADGSDVELVSTGFRNEYDIAFNPLGDLFTYDADMEWDIGTPWYRPTRVNHVISGAEFGWRNGTGKWPEYFADSFGAVANIGYGSPTGIAFGTGAKFPARFQNALYVSDWSYGVVYAVHLEPEGASYKSTFEPFVSAAPMPVTDLLIHPEQGCMYMTIGGRKTQSALYRIAYSGSESTQPAVFPDNEPAKAARAARHDLEAMHVPGAKLDITAAMRNIGSPDRALRTAARLALEHFDSKQWRDPIQQSLPAQSAITMAVALARKGTPADQVDVNNSLLRLEWSKLDNTQRLELLRAYQLSFLRLGPADPATREKIIAQIDGHFPAADGDSLVDRELARVLIHLEAPKIVDRCVAQMNGSNSAEQQIHYAFCLREAQKGWTPQTRKAYFQWFYDIGTARGGASFGGFLENIRKVAIGNLEDEDKAALGELTGPLPAPKDPLADLAPRSQVKQWSVDELAEKFAAKKSGFNYERGKQMFAVAQCYKCHRFAGQGGIQGPDLTASSQRFSTKDMLTAIIEPNKEISDQYEATVFQTEEETVIGRVANLNGDNLMVATNMLDPGSFTNLKRSDIIEMKPSKASMMPSGLLDTLTEEEIFDLLVYLQSGGNPKSDRYALSTPKR
ncbi:MAG: c-type cytochrome [Planctomycetota bacterium]|nr:c-type cytochrome [Planctomycetota bacterium]